jgi:signal transduction histidine kinase
MRVLIAEDEVLVRQVLGELVSGAEDMELVGRAKDAGEAIALAQSHAPDVVLLDYKMPEGGGPRAAAEISRTCPDAAIVALSAYDDMGAVLDMLRHGASGYLVKGTPTGQILDAIRRSAKGDVVLSPSVTAGVIKELMAALDSSESMARELRHLDETKSELIQTLAHELRTPVTIIQGSAGILVGRGADLDPAAAQQLSSNIAKGTARLTRLAGNIAVAASMEHGGTGLSVCPVLVSEIVADAAAQFSSDCERILVGAVEDGKVWADCKLAVHALVAVIENALALSPADQMVEVEVDRHDGKMIFKVSDRGPGVPSQTKDAIFRAFTQGDGSTTRRHEGLGIGLYLARLIVEAHQGTVHCLDRPGGGAIFTLEFPADPVSWGESE